MASSGFTMIFFASRFPSTIPPMSFTGCEGLKKLNSGFPESALRTESFPLLYPLAEGAKISGAFPVVSISNPAGSATESFGGAPPLRPIVWMGVVLFVVPVSGTNPKFPEDEGGDREIFLLPVSKFRLKSAIS
jgi:hypothetical protein